MAQLQINAEKRSKLGGSTALQLRNKGRIPGIVYGHGEASIPFHVKELDLRPLIYTHETHTVNLNIDGEPTLCILREVQFHPVTDRVSHIDLIAIHAGEKIKVDVPVRLVGTAIGTKDGGILNFVLHKLNIEVLPDAIPEHIDVDVSDLKIGHAKHVSDLPEHPAYTISGEANAVIVAVVPPKAAEEAAATTEAVVTEPEQIKAKGKKEEEEGASAKA
ncbi:MAG: 50S ribosomal protein L25 [Bacteroidota bacterium]|nr:50S ribosomal protein L25 [Bacteroidota bacterium]MDP4232822.1 50S ribosomal protein L25 [Bacteroidota bacterium]MDP4242497.1 50S ribosomal protein L25 [Bacteroidota bacterium]MDP4289025.1 50S ribosomal protein L25 [Bacteroidota bacterium]